MIGHVDPSGSHVRRHLCGGRYLPADANITHASRGGAPGLRMYRDRQSEFKRTFRRL